MWAFLVGLGVFVGLVLLLFVLRRLRERGAPRETRSSRIRNGERRGSSPTPPLGLSTDARRRQPPSEAPASGGGRVSELGIGVRSLLLRTVAERAPAGWSALVLCPPAHPDRMTWHVHLAPEVALDLKDGRSVPVSGPAPSHEWQLAGGRTVGIGDGDPVPPPTDETINVRATGPYLVVEVSREGDQPAILTAQVLGEAADELPRPRAAASDVRAVQGALREAVELAVGSKMLGPAPAAGYRPASWGAHERIWLTISR
jgi:hypothetical protein